MQIPDDPQVVNIMGAEYFVPWKDLPRGGSFFLPTTATAKQVYEILASVEKALNLQLEVRQRCEHGRFGVRVWRTY